MSESTIRSVHRALRILEAFRIQDEGVTLSEIARRTELNKMTALRLLGTLEESRYVERLPSGGYRLGGAVMQLAKVFSASLKLEDYVMPCLQRLGTKSGESASFYRRDQDHRVCLFRVDSQHRVRAQTRVGDRVPLPKGAFGRVLIRYEDAENCKAGCPAIVITYADNDPELATVAAPIFDFTMGVIGAVGVSLPIYRYTDEVALRLATLVQEEAGLLTEQLGGSISFHQEALPDDYVLFRGKDALQNNAHLIEKPVM